MLFNRYVALTRLHKLRLFMQLLALCSANSGDSVWFEGVWWKFSRDAFAIELNDFQVDSLI